MRILSLIAVLVTQSAFSADIEIDPELIQDVGAGKVQDLLAYAAEFSPRPVTRIDYIYDEPPSGSLAAFVEYEPITIGDNEFQCSNLAFYHSSQFQHIEELEPTKRLQHKGEWFTSGTPNSWTACLTQELDQQGLIRSDDVSCEAIVKILQALAAGEYDVKPSSEYKSVNVEMKKLAKSHWTARLKLSRITSVSKGLRNGSPVIYMHSEDSDGMLYLNTLTYGDNRLMLIESIEYVL